MKIAKALAPYRAKVSGNIVFPATISASKEELAEYKASKGEYYRETEAGEPMFFSNKPVDAGVELHKTQAGAWIVLDDLKKEYEQKREAQIRAGAMAEEVRTLLGISKESMGEMMLQKMLA